MLFDATRPTLLSALLLASLPVLAEQETQIQALQREKTALEQEIAALTAANKEKRQRLEGLNLKIQELLKQRKALDSRIIDEKQRL